MGGSIFFFFNDTATTEIYTLSLHDALPISSDSISGARVLVVGTGEGAQFTAINDALSQARFGDTIELLGGERSEEHTSELQSRPHLVCRLLLEKKKTTWATVPTTSRYRPEP